MVVYYIHHCTIHASKLEIVLNYILNPISQ